MKTKITALVVALIGLSVIGLSNMASAQGPVTQLEGIRISTDPFPVQSGEDADVRFKIKNSGDIAAEDVTLEILDSYPFQLKPDRKRNYSLGTIEPGERYFVSTEILVAEDAPDGNNDFKVRIKNGDFSVVEKIPVPVQSEDIELNLANLRTTPSKLMPDTEDNKMSVEVVNNGEKTAENVVLELDLPENFEKTSSFSERQELGNVQSGQLKTAQFTFDIGEKASQGTKTIPTTLTYSASDNTAEIKEEKSLDVYLSGKPQFEIVSATSDLAVGQTGKIEIKVKNTGSEKSDSTRIRILDNSDLPFSFESSNKFLGTLKPGKEGTVEFETTVEQDGTAKEYLLDFEVRGVKDSEVFVENKVRSFQVEEGGRAQSQDMSMNIVAGLMGLVVGLIGGYFLKKRVL